MFSGDMFAGRHAHADDDELDDKSRRVVRKWTTEEDQLMLKLVCGNPSSKKLSATRCGTARLHICAVLLKRPSSVLECFFIRSLYLFVEFCVCGGGARVRLNTVQPYEGTGHTSTVHVVESSSWSRFNQILLRNTLTFRVALAFASCVAGIGARHQALGLDWGASQRPHG